MDFCRNGAPLSPTGLASAAEEIRVEPAALWAVVTVETQGCGFLPDRRPQILFERHVFHRETRGAFDAAAAAISDPSPGGYGPPGAHQYERLAAAIALDRRAALRSASWGIGQIMGFHAESLHFADVEAMVDAMVASEDAQLDAMARFITVVGLDEAMRRHAWANFARGYNGPAYATNQYDTKLERAYATLTSKGLPDFRIRAAQFYLTCRSFSPGPIDGVAGDLTRAALRRFQEQAGLGATGDLDDETLARLAAASAASEDAERPGG
jgi:N-acetylmuramidase-like protein/putative peptidoglycan binding protein